jgi:hypothetical protein
MRAALLLALLFACERSPRFANDPDTLSWRSRSTVAESAVAQMSRDVRERSDYWAGQPYLLTLRGRVVGHQKIHLREYEPVVGVFRTVAPEDEAVMACHEVRRTLSALEKWAARIDIDWDVALGPARGRVPGKAAEIEHAACAAPQSADPVSVRLRYSDRPR